MIYDAHIATFMEILTGKNPGEWAPKFIEACQSLSVDPQDFLDLITELRMNGYKMLTCEHNQTHKDELPSGQHWMVKCLECGLILECE